MPSLLVRTGFFLSSYFPLAVMYFLLLAFKFKQPVAGGVLLSVFLLGVLVNLFHLRSAPRSLSPHEVTFKKAVRKESDSIAYLVAYIVPFMLRPAEGWEKLVSAGIFVVVLGVIYVNSGMFHVNPMLSIMGFRVYEITEEQTEINKFLIAFRSVSAPQTLSVVSLWDDVLIEAKEKKHAE